VSEEHHNRDWDLEVYGLYQKLGAMLDGSVKAEFRGDVTKLTQFFYRYSKHGNELNWKERSFCNLP
jgi:hypothetical protein